MATAAIPNFIHEQCPGDAARMTATRTTTKESKIYPHTFAMVFT
jgi:hypothetical protein